MREKKVKSVFRVEGFDHLRFGDTIVVPAPVKFTPTLDFTSFDIEEKKDYYIRLPEGDIQVPPYNSLSFPMKVGAIFSLPNNYKQQSLWDRLTRKPKVPKVFKVVEVFPTMAQYEAID